MLLLKLLSHLLATQLDVQLGTTVQFLQHKYFQLSFSEPQKASLPKLNSNGAQLVEIPLFKVKTIGELSFLTHRFSKVLIMYKMCKRVKSVAIRLYILTLLAVCLSQRRGDQCRGALTPRARRVCRTKCSARCTDTQRNMYIVIQRSNTCSPCDIRFLFQKDVS